MTEKAGGRARANLAVADAVAKAANAGTVATGNAAADVAASVVTESDKAESAANHAKVRPRFAAKCKSGSPGRHVSPVKYGKAVGPATVSGAVAVDAATRKYGMCERTRPTGWKAARRKVQSQCRNHFRAKLAQRHPSACRADVASVETARIATTAEIEAIAMWMRRAIAAPMG